MNGRPGRALIAHAVLIVALCMGGWTIFVQPRMTRLNALEDLIAVHESEGLGLEQTALENIASEAAEIGARLETIERANALGDDSSQIYALLMDVARRHEVFVHNLTPGAEANTLSPGVKARQVTMSIEGEFEEVAAFLDAVSTIPGFMRPASLAVVPQLSEDGRPMVVANLGYELLTFAVPEALRSMKGGDHVEP